MIVIYDLSTQLKLNIKWSVDVILAENNRTNEKAIYSWFYVKIIIISKTICNNSRF